MTAPSHLRTCPVEACGKILRHTQYLCKTHWFRLGEVDRSELLAAARRGGPVLEQALAKGAAKLAPKPVPAVSIEQALAPPADPKPVTYDTYDATNRYSANAIKRRQRGRR